MTRIPMNSMVFRHIRKIAVLIVGGTVLPFFARKPCGLPQGGMADLASQGSAKMPRGLPRGASLIGVALIILPGPAFLVIPAGLAIEFAWARRLLNKAKSMATHDIPKYTSWKRWFKNRGGEEEKKNNGQ